PPTRSMRTPSLHDALPISPPGPVVTAHTDPPERTAEPLNHLRADGTAHMVDISSKQVTAREATATGKVRLSAAAVRALREGTARSEEHTSELQSRENLVCR